MILPPITRILTRRPAPNLAAGLTTQEHLGAPDYPTAMQQYDSYLDALRSLNLAVTVLPPDERFPDGHFIEDAAILFRDMAFICRSGAESRAQEGAELVQHLNEFRIVSIHGDEGLVDGGDVLFCADRVLIGLSTRTNREGAKQLASALKDVQNNLRVDVVEFSGVLHLKTALNELATGILVVADNIHTDYNLDFAEIVPIPAEEMYAANLVPINETLLIAAGFPKTLDLVRKHYSSDRIIALEMSEFQKMDGGLSCLSLRY